MNCEHIYEIGCLFVFIQGFMYLLFIEIQRVQWIDLVLYCSMIIILMQNE